MSHWDRDDSYINRSTGPRREPPAVCYTCGDDVPDTPRFGTEATCDDCARRAPAESPAPFTFTDGGRTFTCAWHDGFDKMHPANVGASHGACPDCLERMLAECKR